MKTPFRKPKSFDYNIIVIGAGAAGLVSSLIGSTVGAKVLLIEKHKMGGDCLNTGCVPSKAILRVAKTANEAKKANQWGIETSIEAIDFSKIKAHVQQAIKAIEPNDSVERYKSLGVDVEQGAAMLMSPWEVSVNNKSFTARRIIIATGASPFVPPIEGINTIDYLTSDTIWSLDKLPKSLAVVGGGAIGCELSQAFARLGVDVTLIEAQKRIMARSDSEVSTVLTKALETDGVTVVTGHMLKKIEAAGSSATLHIERDTIRQEIHAEKVLIAIGRKPNVTGFGLDAIGVELTERGAIKVNEKLQTNYPHIYSCGDCIGGIQLTHVSGHEAWYAAVNALFGRVRSFKADYRVIPAAVFTDPEVASVGITEDEAKQQGLDYETTVFEMAEIDRAIADGETAGFIKIITPKNKDAILGVSIVGAHASDILMEFTLAMKNGLGLKKILGTVHLYPSYQDGAKLAAGAWQKAHKPEGILRLLKKFFHCLIK